MGEVEMMGAMVNAQEAVFEAFKAHTSGLRVSTELTMLTTIRQAHPEMLVTQTSPRTCDLLGYAEAGLARVSGSNLEQSEYSRHWKPSGSRVDGNRATLKNKFSFVQWQYTWEKHEFILYQIRYMDPRQGNVTLFFLLSPKAWSSEGIVSPTDELLLAVGAWSAELHSEIYVFDDGYWSKNKELWESVQGSSWEDVILKADMKANLISDVQGFFDNKALYKSLGVPWKRGLILHGVPGNGKTISIKALISSLSSRKEPVPSLYVKSFDACQGQKFSVRSIFQHARAMAPCLLIFEDLDSLITDKTRSYFLNEVDGLESNDGILMIGSTNHLETLDPAISKRPSRFDRKYHFMIPDEEERTAYSKFWRSKLLENKLVEFPEELCAVIGKLSAGFSFAYLKELFVATLLTVARGTSVDEDVDENSTSNRKTDATEGFDNKKAESIQIEAIVANASANSSPSAPAGNPPKRNISNVEIPDGLKDNMLLKVIRREIGTLLAEMDNTNEGEWPSTKKQVGGDGVVAFGKSRMMPSVRAMPIMQAI